MSARKRANPNVRARVFTQVGAPVAKLDRWQQIGKAEAQAAYDMTLRNELSGGTPVVRAFEKTWREWVGSRYAISVSNGTMSLFSAFFGVGVGPGDEVICPTYTWICSLSPALILGARPVFAESDPDTLMIDPEDVRRKITKKTRAIVAVHLWGNVCDLGRLMKISRETGVPLIEDCSHAHGAKYRGRHIGTFGAAGCWSMQGSKSVSAGEGGMMVTDDIDVFERACLLGQVNRIKGIDLATTRYEALQPFGIGMKTRAHPLGIGIAAVQLKRLAKLNAGRKAYVEEVEAGLADIPGLRAVKVYKGAERGGYLGFPIFHDREVTGLTTEQFIARVNAEGIPATPDPYCMLHNISMFRDGFDIFTRRRCGLSKGYKGYRKSDFPVTEGAHTRILFLPMLTEPVKGAPKRVLRALRAAAGR